MNTGQSDGTAPPKLVVLGEWTFRHVAEVVPDLDPAGLPIEHFPQERYAKAATSALNPHGVGPFCRIQLRGLPAQPGVYAVAISSTPVYVGIAQDLSRRWGLTGYGSIQPKNCFVGGQSTNCKVNSAILRSWQEGHRIDLYFHQSNERRTVEARLIEMLKPAWNGR